MISGLQRYAEYAQYGRQIKEQITIKDGNGIAVSIKPVRLYPYWKHTAFQPCFQTFDPGQMKGQVMSRKEIIHHQRNAAKNRQK